MRPCIVCRAVTPSNPRRSARMPSTAARPPDRVVMQGMSNALDSRRIALSSNRLFFPSGVLITICTRPPRISSPMWWVPSPTLATGAAANP